MPRLISFCKSFFMSVISFSCFSCKRLMIFRRSRATRANNLQQKNRNLYLFFLGVLYYFFFLHFNRTCGIGLGQSIGHLTGGLLKQRFAPHHFGYGVGTASPRIGQSHNRSSGSHFYTDKTFIACFDLEY